MNAENHYKTIAFGIYWGDGLMLPLTTLGEGNADDSWEGWVKMI
jgi:hypothetical protein